MYELAAMAQHMPHVVQVCKQAKILFACDCMHKLLQLQYFYTFTCMYVCVFVFTINGE